MKNIKAIIQKYTVAIDNGNFMREHLPLMNELVTKSYIRQPEIYIIKEADRCRQETLNYIQETTSPESFKLLCEKVEQSRYLTKECTADTFPRLSHDYRWFAKRFSQNTK